MKRIIITVILIVCVLAVLLIFLKPFNPKVLVTPTITNTPQTLVDLPITKSEPISISFFTQTLSEICQTPRKLGTDGAGLARDYISEKLSLYGYPVMEQDFDYKDSQSSDTEQVQIKGTNIIAIKNAIINNPDILIVSAHYDTVSGTVGANNNGSGVALLLELARSIANEETDTEIRFVLFSGKEEGLLGSSFYVDSLTADEKDRVIGNINIDTIGHYMSDYVGIFTVDGKETLIGDLLNNEAIKINGRMLESGVRRESDHTSFINGGIPAVLISQNNQGVENQTVLDNLDIIDFNKIKPVADILLETLKTIMGEETSNLSTEAYKIAEGNDPSILISEETIFYFGEKKELTDGKIGSPGKLITQKHIEELDWDLEYYLYNAKWFGMDESMPTVLIYRVIEPLKFLNEIEVNFTEVGFTMEQMQGILTEKFGDPIYVVDNYENIDYKDYVWGDELHALQYVLNWKNDGWILKVEGVYTGGGKDIKIYDLTNGIEQYKDADPLHYELMEFLQKISSDYMSYINFLDIWTDGISHQLGASYPTNEGDNSKFTVRMDINDIFDTNGNYRNFDKTLATFVHEFGHVLTLNNSQVDLSKQPPEKFYFIYDSFTENSYLKAFYDKFWSSDLLLDNVGNYQEFPTDFVDEYAATNGNEDIAESFMLFVLSNKPTGNTVAEQKINFFYEYPELLTLREAIRLNFGYE